MPAQLFALFPHLALAVGGLAALSLAMLRETTARRLLPPLAAVFALVPGLWALCPGADTSGITRFFAGLLAVITCVTVGQLARYADKRGFAGDALYGLLLWSALGMLLLAEATDWVMLTLGLELASLCLYALVAARQDAPFGAEAALKYFLPGAMALASLIFGTSLLYAGSGSLDIATSLAAGSPIGIAGLALALCGLGFKLSLAPVHLWTPDTYQGAPAPVAAFLSTGSKAAAAAALLHICAMASPQAMSLVGPMLTVVAGATMAVGNIGALRQRSLKRLLAYSSIAQMGYIAMAALAVDEGGGEAALFYLAAYALMDLGAFGALGALSGTIDDLDNIESYRGLGYTRPWRAGVLALCLLSLAGLPPTAGFIGKFMVFGAALRAGYTGLAVFGILMAIIGIVYALRVVMALYMHAPETPRAPSLRTATTDTVATHTGPAAAIALWVVSLGVLALGVFPSPLIAAIARLVGGE